VQTTEEIQETIALWGDKYHNAIISDEIIEFRILLTNFTLMIPQQANSPWILAADGKTLLRTNKTGKALLGIVEHKAIKRAKEDELKTLETHLNKARDYGRWDLLLRRMVENRLYCGLKYRGIFGENTQKTNFKIYLRQDYFLQLIFKKKEVYLELYVGKRPDHHRIVTTSVCSFDITNPEFDIYEVAENLAEKIANLRNKLHNQIGTFHDRLTKELIS
jgi:hypothetical protein